MFPRLCSRSFTFRPVYYTSKFRHFISQIESPPLCRQCTTFLLFYPSSFIYWNCNSSMSAGIALTRGADFAVFRFPRVTCSTYYRKICHAGRPKVPTPCKTSGRLGHIWGFFLPQKHQKNPQFCKLIHSVEANPLFDIHEIYRFHVVVGSMKVFEIWSDSAHKLASCSRKLQ